jgi:large subunit ribosomal protein L15
VNLNQLEKMFETGDAVNPEVLLAKGLVRRQRGRIPSVKILGTGEVSKKFTVSGCEVSAGAREKLEQAGSTIV